MERKEFNVIDTAGNAIRGASVLIKTYPGGVTATLYEDDEVTPLANPLTTDISGQCWAKAANGHYSQTISKTGITTETTNDIIFFDPTDYAAMMADSGGAALIGNNPSGGISATTVQTAINELDNEKASLAAIAASSGSSLVGFIAAGTAPRQRTSEDKMRDINSVADRAGIDKTGASDSATAFNNAVTSSNHNWIPSGTYLIDSATTVATGKALLIEAGTTINYGSGDSITNNGIIYGFGGANHTLSGSAPETTRGFSIIQNNIAGTALSSEPNEVDFNLLKISGDSIDVEGGTGAATKANGLAVLYRFGGSNTTGGRHGLYSFLELTAATSASSTDRNYVAFQSWFLASANDGGTGGVKKGAAFGGGAEAELATAATHYQNVTAWEFNTKIAAATAPDYRSGIQIASRDADRGVTYDGMISLSDISSTAGGKWLNGILIGNQNSQHPLDTTNGTIIKTIGSATIKNVIDVSSYTVSGSLIKTVTTDFSDTSLGMGAANASVELGSKTASNGPFIDFNSSGGNFDYDVRLAASGGLVSAGKGVLTVTANSIVLPNTTASLEIGAKGSANTPFIDFNSSGNSNDYDARIIASGGTTTGSGALTFIINNFVLSNASVGVDLGAKASSNTPFIDFNSSGNNNDYDSRIIADGGTGSSGNGNLTATCAKFTVSGQLIGGGTATNDSAAAGKIGEFITSTVAAGAAVSLTNNTSANVTSISLTAGDWWVWAQADFTLTGATSTHHKLGISATSATLPTQAGGSGIGTDALAILPLATTVLSDTLTMNVATRVTLTATTTIYMVAESAFSAGTDAVYGTISARRPR